MPKNEISKGTVVHINWHVNAGKCLILLVILLIDCSFIYKINVLLVEVLWERIVLFIYSFIPQNGGSMKQRSICRMLLQIQMELIYGETLWAYFNSMLLQASFFLVVIVIRNWYIINGYLKTIRKANNLVIISYCLVMKENSALFYLVDEYSNDWKITRN